MAKIINCTPHDVCVYSGSLFDPHQGCNVGGTEILRFPASGCVATAKSSVEAMAPIDVDGIQIPLCQRGFSGLTALPEGGNAYIVSSLYAQAAESLGEDTDNLLVPYGTVRHNGKIVGCIGLAKTAKKEADAA